MRNAALTLGLAEAVLDYTSGSFGPALEKIEAFSDGDRGCRACPRGDGIQVARSCSPPSTGKPSHSACRLKAMPQASETTRDGRCACGRASAAVSSCRPAGLPTPPRRWQGIVAAPQKGVPVAVLDAVFAVTLGRAAIHTGDEPQLRRCAAVAQELLGTGTPAVQRHGAWLLALLAMGEGDAAAALAHLCALGKDERLSVLPLFPPDVTDKVPLVRIALAAGDGELARSAMASARERLRLNPDVASIAGTAAHTEGLVTGDTDHLALAVKRFENAPRPLALASALEDAGKAVAWLGNRQEGVALLGRALELYAQAGASWDGSRVRGRLRALGVRRRLAIGAPPQHGW